MFSSRHLSCLRLEFVSYKLYINDYFKSLTFASYKHLAIALIDPQQKMFTMKATSVVQPFLSKTPYRYKFLLVQKLALE